jgi:hypothetical protein
MRALMTGLAAAFLGTIACAPKTPAPETRMPAPLEVSLEGQEPIRDMNAGLICAGLVARGLATDCVSEVQDEPVEDTDGTHYEFATVGERGRGFILSFRSQEGCHREIAAQLANRPETELLMLRRCDARYLVVVVAETWTPRRKIAAALGIDPGEEQPCPPGVESRDGRCVESLVAQCNRVIEVINVQQTPLRDLRGSDPDELRKLAAALEAVAAAVGSVDVEDAMLKQHRDDYAAMATDLAADSRETADALAANDARRASKAAERMGTYSPRESAIVAAINLYCTGSE